MNVSSILRRKGTQVETLRTGAMAGEALVGLVSIGDVVKYRLDESKLEVGVLRDYARATR